jgi:endonuclease/exonuclease/phosphatase family metal-dependent hydrolase
MILIREIAFASAMLGFVLSLAETQSSPGPEPDPLVTTGSFAKEVAEIPDRLRVVCYNLHGPPAERIDEMIELLQSHPALKDAGVLALQEVNRDHLGSANRDVGRELARALQMHYVYAVEIYHGTGGGVRGLAFLSRFALEDIDRVLLPVAGPGGRRRIALGATVLLGDRRLRLYTTHLETRISVKNRGAQINGILAHLERKPAIPTVVLGDFNTFTRGARKKMFEIMEGAGFESSLPGNQTTFQRMFLLRLKLDWIWARDVDVLEANVETDIRVSDHRPLWLEINVNTLPEA